MPKHSGDGKKEKVKKRERKKKKKNQTGVPFYQPHSN